MFFSAQLLSRKSPLGIVWLASHSDGKKLKRTQLSEFSIINSCDSIINPEAPLALRLSGQLLLGVVRIYSRKLAFLETDARNAIDGLQRKDGSLVSVDLPDGGIAAERSITLNRRNAGSMDANNANNANMLFPSFDVSAGFSGGAKTSTSSAYTLAEDISDVFGSTRWTGSEDRFANSELFSTELERLRDAQVAVDNLEENNNLFMDDMMDAPLPELFEQPGSLMVDPGKTPRSVAGVEGDKGRGNLETVGMFEQQDDGWGYDDYGGMDDVMGDVDAALPSPATPENQPSKKKKKKLQVDEEIVLDDDEVKRLMRNRASLVKPRGGEAAGSSYSSESHRRRLVSVSRDEDFAWMFVEPEKSRAAGDGGPARHAGDGHAADHQSNQAEQPVFQDFGYDDYGGDHEDYFEDPLMGSLPLTPMQDAADADAAPTMPADGFTARTQSVLKQMRERGKTVSLNDLVENKTRLEACRWFFESLVLRNKGYVDLEQREPYGDIEIAML